MIGISIGIGVFGLLIGSFLNVVIARLPYGQSIAYPPSHCPKCRKNIAWRDLIPVFSYFFLGGKCRNCHLKISWIYPFIEGITGVSFFLIAYMSNTLNPELLVQLFLISILIVMSAIDIEHGIIPNQLVLTSLVGGVLLRIFSSPLPAWDYLTAMMLGSFLLLCVAILSKGGMGGGDIKFYLFVGLMLGIKLTLLSIFLASLYGFIFGLVFRRKLQGTIVFGPFISCGVLTSYFYGQDILRWYVNFFLV